MEYDSDLESDRMFHNIRCAYVSGHARSQEISKESGCDTYPPPTQPRPSENEDRKRAWPIAKDSTASPKDDYPAYIRLVCDELKNFLINKNQSYGASVFEPVGVFCNLSPRDQILCRIDDKLARIRAGCSYPGDDTIKDTAGYLILLMVLDSFK